MKLNEIPKEELELMGYDDIALIILQETGKKMKLQDIFKKVCKVLNLSDDIVDSQIMDFFEQMSINKKFIMLKNGYWDLQSRHKLDIVLEEDDEEEIELNEEDEELTIEDVDTEENDDIFYDKDDETDDEADDELADFAVIDEADEENL